MLFFLLLPACSVFQPIDGAWLFQFERESTASGDCAADDSGGGGNSTYTGTENYWVDAYTLSGNQVAIVFGGEALIGTLTGANVEVSHDVGYKSGGTSETDSNSIEATLADGVMEGTYTSETKWSGSGDDYRCTNQVGFTANRATSMPDEYATH